MTDDLDRDALAYMQQRNPNFTSSPLSYTPQPFSGGKIGTKRSKKDIQKSQGGTYISDEPERFEKYVDDFKDEFTTPEQAKQKIIEKWSRDSSLSNLLRGIENSYGGAALDRELTALVNSRGVKASFAYVQVAKKLKLSEKRFRVNILPFVVESKLTEVAERIRRNRRAEVNVTELVRQSATGSVRGTETQGRLSVFRIGRSQLVRYRDNKGRFIKVN